MTPAATPYAVTRRRLAQRRRWIVAIATPVLGAVLLHLAAPLFAGDTLIFILSMWPISLVLAMTLAGAAARARAAAIVIVGVCGLLALGAVQSYVLVEATRGIGAPIGLVIILPVVGALAAFVGSLLGLIIAKIVLGPKRSAAELASDRLQRCSCGYSLVGLTTGVCPECGRPIEGTR